MKKDERIRQLEAELEAKNTVIESLKQELNYVREQLVLYKKTFYGSRSEKIEIPDQLTLNLFNEAETESTVLKTEPELQVRVTSHSRKKSKKRGIEDLPETGKPLRLIGTNERKELVHHKEYYEVIKHIQYVYSGEYDEEIETTPMYKGDMPKAVIPKSFASPSLLASILDKKYNLSLPLYR